MKGVCDQHKYRKRGACKDCGVCKCCDPPEDCNIQLSHVNWKRKAKRLGIAIDMDNNGASASSHEGYKSSITPRRSKRSSDLRGKKQKLLSKKDNDDDFYLPGTCNKDILSKVCNLLNISTSILEMPKEGFTVESMDTAARSFSWGSRIVRTLFTRICNLVSPNNTKFKEK